MRHFDDVLSAFKAVAEDLERRFVEALLGTEGAVEWEVVEGWSRINSQAHFILLFSQLEAEVNRLCEDLIRHMQTRADWAERRAWDILDHREDRIRNIRFLNRVALLTDKGGTVYKRVKELYETRSRIAHGDLLTEPLDVAKIAEDIERIAVQLKGVS